MLTLKEAAEKIGLSYITLQQQARKGVLKTERIGNLYVVTPAALAEYEREHKGKPGGFQNPSHPLYGKRGAGGRKKRE